MAFAWMSSLSFPNTRPFLTSRTSYDGRPEFIYASGPKLHDYLQEMNREVLSKYDIMTVGEAFGVTLEQTPLLVDERRNELNMIFHFDVVRFGPRGGAGDGSRGLCPI